jgi:hypothetical protein
MKLLDWLVSKFRLLVFWLIHFWRKPKKGAGISLLVPFRADGARRQETWEWLAAYWKAELPGAEVVIGTDDKTPFCKTAAVNRAAATAKGDILVVLDADCYIHGDVILDCAAQIREARATGRKLWFIPYRYFYRLSDINSRVVMSAPPDAPPRFFAAPPNYQLSDMSYTGTSIVCGHWFGALIQIIPREAFDLVKGMDERFAGWGGEDVSNMHLLDTLYGKHRTTANGVIHLWHPSIGVDVKTREWAGQEKANINGRLAWRYSQAVGDKARMQALVDQRG